MSLILGKAVMSIVYGVMIFFFLGYIISAGKTEREKLNHSLKDMSYILKPILLFLLYCLLSLLWSHHLGVSIQGFGKFFRNFLLIVVIFSTFKSVQDACWFYRFLVLGAVLASANGIIQHFLRVDLFLGHDFWGNRVRSSFPDPGTLASYLGLFLPVSVMLLKQSQGRSKAESLFYTIALLLIIIGLYMSFTKGIIFFLSLITLFSFFLLEIPKKIKLFAGGLAYGAIFFLFLSPPPILSSLGSQLDVSLKERLSLWSVSQKMIQDSPILGHGLNTYSKINVQYFPPLSEWGSVHEYLYLAYPHNGYLKIWVEIGFIGLLLYLIIYFQLLKRLYLSIKSSSGEKKFRLLCYGVSFITFICSSFFDTFMESTQTRYALWVLVGAMLLEFKSSEEKLTTH